MSDTSRWATAVGPRSNQHLRRSDLEVLELSGPLYDGLYEYLKRAAMIGRPVLWGLAAGGEAGVADVLEIFRREIALAMQLLGCAGCDTIARAHVQHGPDPAA